MQNKKHTQIISMTETHTHIIITNNLNHIWITHKPSANHIQCLHHSCTTHTESYRNKTNITTMHTRILQTNPVNNTYIRHTHPHTTNLQQSYTKQTHNASLHSYAQHAILKQNPDTHQTTNDKTNIKRIHIYKSYTPHIQIIHIIIQNSYTQQTTRSNS